jgi:hypothetical protein
MKNGIREGKTTSHHILRPVTDAIYVSFGYIIIEKAIMIAEAAMIKDFKYALFIRGVLLSPKNYALLTCPHPYLYV